MGQSKVNQLEPGEKEAMDVQCMAERINVNVFLGENIIMYTVDKIHPDQLYDVIWESRTIIMH